MVAFLPECLALEQMELYGLGATMVEVNLAKTLAAIQTRLLHNKSDQEHGQMFLRGISLLLRLGQMGRCGLGVKMVTGVSEMGLLEATTYPQFKLAD
jgi:hypothetical protein